MKIRNLSAAFKSPHHRNLVFSLLSLGGMILCLDARDVFAGTCAEVAKLKAKDYFINNSTDTKPIFNPWASEPRLIDGKLVYHVAVPYCEVDAPSCPTLENALRSNYELSFIDDGSCKLVQEPKYLGDTTPAGVSVPRLLEKKKAATSVAHTTVEHDPCEALVKKRSGFKDAEILQITENQETGLMSYLVSDRTSGGKVKKIVQLREEDRSLWKKNGCLAVYVSHLHSGQRSGQSELPKEVFTPDYKPMITQRRAPTTDSTVIGGAPPPAGGGIPTDAAKIH